MYFVFCKMNIEDIAREYIDEWEDEDKYNPAINCICFCENNIQMWIMNGDWYCVMYVEDEDRMMEELGIAYSYVGAEFGSPTVLAVNDDVVV